MDNDCILPMFPQQQQPGKPQDYPRRKGTLAFPRHGEQCAARATPGTHPPPRPHASGRPSSHRDPRMPSWQRQELKRKQPGAGGDLPQPMGAVQSDRSLATRVAEEAGLVEGLVLRDHRSLTDTLGLLGDSHHCAPQLDPRTGHRSAPAPSLHSISHGVLSFYCNRTTAP